VKISAITHEDLTQAKKILQVASFNAAIKIMCERLKHQNSLIKEDQ